MTEPTIAQAAFEQNHSGANNGILIKLAEKAVIDELIKVRRSLTPVQERFALPSINLLIDELKSLTRATPTQREEMVLFAVERSGAVTEVEIAEDTKLHRKIVDEVLVGLYSKEILYRVRRRVIGSDRPQYAIKSNRLKLPEGD